jgi:hypothetical protein
VRVATCIRNDSGRDVTVTIDRPPDSSETVRIPAGRPRTVDGVFAGADPQRQQRWHIDDGERRLLVSDVSPIATLPDDFVSSSRLTSDFPCNRVTRHVRLTAGGDVEANATWGRKRPQPAGFPIHPVEEPSP